MNRVVYLLGLCVALSGCDIIDAAGKDRPNSAQKDAVGAIFSQAGTFGDVFSDPVNANSTDLGKLVDFEHFAIAVDPSFRGTASASVASPQVQAPVAEVTTLIRQVLAAPPPGCVEKISETEFKLVDCDVFMPNGDVCIMNADGISTVENGGTTYEGTFSIKPGDASCFLLDIAIKLFMIGPASAPTTVSGVCLFNRKDDTGSIIYKGYIELVDVAIEAPCDVPSTGSFIIAMKGVYRALGIDGLIEITFNSKPACGAMFIGRKGAYEDPMMTL